MEKMIHFFIQRSLVVNFMVIFIVLAGYLATTSMERNIHPPFKFKRIVIRVALTGATPEEMEKHITFPIEEALQGLPQVEDITSMSFRGKSRITLYYPSSFKNISEVTDLVRNKVHSIRYRLPTNIRFIQVEQKRVEEGRLLWLGIEGVDQNDTQHREFFKSLKKDLTQIKGIQKVGSEESNRDIYVEFHPDKLRANELSVTKVRQTIKQAINFSPIGEVQLDEDKYSIEVSQTLKTLEQLANIPIRGNRMGDQLKIKDIAKVGYKLEEKGYINRINGKPGFGISIFPNLLMDSIDLKKAVVEVMDEYNAKAPSGVRIITILDDSKFIENQLSVLTKNGILGLLIVFLLLTLFLNWKTALVASLALPIAYFGTMLILCLWGFNLDLPTLVGMILVIGMLVDGSIIISERYMENLESGMNPQEAAGRSVRDLIIPITGTVLTSVIAFTPMFMNQSPMGQMIISLPAVVISALLLSWLESFFILPNHLAHFVRTPCRRVFIFNRIKQVYESLLTFTLRFRYLVLLVVFGITFLAYHLAMNRLQVNYKFYMDHKYIAIHIVLKESESREATLSKIKPLEDYVRSLSKDEISVVQSNVGNIVINRRYLQGYRYAQIYADVNKDHKYPSLLQEKVKAKLEEFIRNYDKTDFERIRVSFHASDNDQVKKQLISVSVRGSDRVEFEDIEAEIIEVAIKMKEVASYFPNPRQYQKAWEFVPEPKALVKYNLSAYDVSRQIRGTFTPDEVAEVRLGGESVYIYTQMLRSENEELHFDQIGDYEVITASGSGVPLKYLGEWKKKKSLRQISHTNRLRDMTVDFEIDETQGNYFSASVGLKKALGPVMEKFPDYEIKITESREEKKNKAWVKQVAILCILSVLFIITLILGSFTQPLLVGFPILFGGVGIVFSFYLHGMELGAMSLIGFVGTVGVSVNASIVMVDHINRLTKKAGGKLSEDLLIQGASSRLKAILLTTITTLGGIFPIAYSLGGESGFTQPLVFALGWGISSATLLTLFILPSLLQVREDIFSLVKGSRTKIKAMWASEE